MSAQAVKDALDETFEQYAEEEGANELLAAKAAEIARKMMEMAPDDESGIMADSDEPVVISSLVVETAKEYTDDVAEQLARMSGVEVHQIVDYKIVVTIEASSTVESADIASEFVNITGVLGIDLVYFNFEEDPTLKTVPEA